MYSVAAATAVTPRRNMISVCMIIIVVLSTVGEGEEPQTGTNVDGEGKGERRQGGEGKYTFLLHSSTGHRAYCCRWLCKREHAEGY